jgi:adenylate cyclase
MRAGVHWGRPRKLGGEYLGKDIGITISVGERARPGQVLASEPVLSQLNGHGGGFRIGRLRRLRSGAAPRELEVALVKRAQPVD